MENNVKQEGGQIDWENPFKAEDIEMSLSNQKTDWGYHLRLGDAGDESLLNISRDIANITNARFRELIKNAPVFYCFKETGPSVWFGTPRRRDFGEATHSAILIMEKEIK